MWKLKMNLTLAGVAFPDELHADVGAAEFTLNHDWFFNDLGNALVIRTAAGGGGTLLVETTDYTISNQDNYLSIEAGVNCYNTIQITNAAYQTGNLYFSGKYVADSNDYQDINRIAFAVNASQTLAPAYLPIYLCTAGAAGIRLTLPDATISPSMMLEFNKVDTGAGCVTLVPYSAQTMNGMPYIFLTEQYQKVVLISDGTNWIIQSGVLFWITGGRNTADWTNRELGMERISYDTKAGTIRVGETVTETETGYTFIIIADSGTVLTCVKATGKGWVTNNNHLTFSQSGATALVNNGATDKDADTSIYHNAGRNAYRFDIETWGFAGTTFAMAGAVRLARAAYYQNGGTDVYGGADCISVDTNTFKMQTGRETGGYLMGEAGSVYALTNQDYSYNIIVKLVF
jgi:hypothetical protein